MLFCLSGTASLAIVSPTAQAEAQEWLEIKVTSVQITEPDSPHSGQVVKAKVDVLRVFKGESRLKVGDHLTIQYVRPSQSKDSASAENRLGPGSPRLLQNGDQTYAFLNKGKNHTYAPGAGVWSFALPMGIPQQERDRLGMQALSRQQPLMIPSVVLPPTNDTVPLASSPSE